MKQIFIITKYAAKAYDEKLHIFIAVKPVSALKRPAVNGDTVSVSGYLQNFTSVVTAANPSLAIANTIATFGSLVIPHNTRASSEQKPQR